MAERCCVAVYILLIHSSVDGHVASFYMSAVIHML
jgi:hypothetical protein